MKRFLLGVIFCLIFGSFVSNWGFYAHQEINRLAIFSLPAEMIGFYKSNIDYIKENAVNPDRRRYAVEGEAPRHYIDLDIYPDSVQKDLRSLSWQKAVEKYTEDTLNAYGIVPWHVNFMKYQLTQAFVKKDAKAILRLSADLGHYIADAHVPLHTTENYNGQLTNQVGIHGFWESRLPELFSKEYEFWVGPAEYIEKPQNRIWEVVLESHAALDSVLSFEMELTNAFPSDKKFTVEERSGITIRNYSRPFSTRYHEMLNNQVERRMKSSVKTIADFWFTCWVDAGQPDLKNLGRYEKSNEELAEEKDLKAAWLQRVLNVRREADEN
ncbi:hypothetical protein SAMN06298216_0273 [Spirosomataceae bacterium TFI 002]|nr:hypothetical protein SAMN06298216_0273 [Spirosomataceae bacterium TFI 002]